MAHLEAQFHQLKKERNKITVLFISFMGLQTYWGRNITHTQVDYAHYVPFEVEVNTVYLTQRVLFVIRQWL